MFAAQRTMRAPWAAMASSFTFGAPSGTTTVAGMLRRRQASAIAALEAARDAQLKRGFQLMFAQGADAPR